MTNACRRTLLFAGVMGAPCRRTACPSLEKPTSRWTIVRPSASNLRPPSAMALFGRDRGEKDRSEVVPPVPTTPADAIAPREVTMSERDTTPGRHAGMDAFLGRGSKVDGKLVLEGTGRIEGQVEGEISAQDTLTIGESAVVNAKISGTTIIIEGCVTGDVCARQRLELRASSRVQGNISTPCLVVHDGALLEGKCSMSRAEVTAHDEKRPVLTALTPERRPDSPVHAATAASR